MTGGPSTSIEKALDVCEMLSQARQGLRVAELARGLKQPPATVHRLLAVLKRRGFVQQDEQTSRYSLTLKMLDLSFRSLGRSELRLHAYPVLREYALSRNGIRAFLAVPRDGEVTYVWRTGPDAVAMHSAYGREMPGHCSLYFAAGSARRLSCLKLERTADRRAAPEGAAGPQPLIRLGDAGAQAAGAQRMNCTCAPIHDYTGGEVARVGLFVHDVTEQSLVGTFHRDAWELARLISLRLGSFAAQTMADTA